MLFEQLLLISGNVLRLRLSSREFSLELTAGAKFFQNWNFFDMDFSEKMLKTIVKTVTGNIRGQILRDIEGNQYLSFRGVPYAKPPVGKLRFKVSSFFKSQIQRLEFWELKYSVNQFLWYSRNVDDCTCAWYF